MWTTLGWALFPVAEDFELMAFSPWGPSPFLGGGQWLGGHQSLWHQTTLASVNCLCVYPGTYMSKAYSSVNGATWQVVQWYSLFIQQQSQHSFSCFYGPYATQKIWEIAWGKGFFFFFFFTPFLFYRSFLPCWAQENSEILLVSVFYQEGEKRDPLLSGFPNFSDGLFKAQGSF